MPFTLSHAAAALPFRRFKPIWPALVIGTFAPDLEYFIRISDEDRSGHHFPKVVLLTLPLALLVLWLFEWVIKRPAIGLLPSQVQRRLQGKIAPLSFRGWQRFGAIVLWIAVGIFTHLVWDQFTHFNTRVTAFWPVLKLSVKLPYVGARPVAGILQHLSTLVGLLVLLIWFVAWYRRTSPAHLAFRPELSARTRASVVAGMVIFALALGCLLGLLVLSYHPPPVTRFVVAATLLEAVTLLFCLELLTYGAAMTLVRRPSGVPATHPSERSR
jgi:hypothetical protein